MTIADLITRFIARLRCSDGQTLMEYGMMVAVIALVVIAAAVLFGGNAASLTTSNAAGI